MARKSVKVEAVGAPTEPPPVEVPALKVPPEVKPVFKFWNKARCPRCGDMDTEAYGTDGPIQYRRCRVPICRWKFTVTGQKA